MKKIDLVIGVLRIPLDFVFTFLALILAYQARLDWLSVTPFPEGVVQPSDTEVRNLALVASVILVVIFFITGRYSFPPHWKIFREIKGLILSVFVWLGVILSALFFFREDFFSRLIIIYAVLFVILFLALERVIIYFATRKLHSVGVGRERLVLIGKNKVADEIVNFYKKNKCAEVVKILGKTDLKNFEKSLKNIDSVIQTIDLPEKESLKIIDLCQWHQVNYSFVPDSLSLERGSNVETFWIEAVPVVSLKMTPLDGWGRVVKRGIDLVGSIFGLIVFSPLFLLIAILIKLDSSGPVFFSRLPNGEKVKRIGRNGRKINFLKFRTMRHNSHNERYKKLAKKSHRKGPLVKIKNDPRITRVGKFLRKTSLDELPQLWNVFMGELSLVGPRAHLPEEVAKYEPYQRRVLTIKPGITGMAQVSGRSDLEFEDEVRLDTWYIENWSVWLDFKIIVKTVGVVFGGKGAD